MGQENFSTASVALNEEVVTRGLHFIFKTAKLQNIGETDSAKSSPD